MSNVDGGWYMNMNGYAGCQLYKGGNLMFRAWKATMQAGISLVSAGDSYTGGNGNISYKYNGDGTIGCGYFNFDSSYNASVMEVWSNGSLVLNGAAFISGDWHHPGYFWLGHAAQRNNSASYALLQSNGGATHLNGHSVDIRISGQPCVYFENANSYQYNGVVYHRRMKMDASTMLTGTYNSSLVTTSDDRLKVNEKLLMDVSSMLLKLRPQTYNKLTEFDGNVEDAQFEVGLIAQEIWYDCPQLRHLVMHSGKPAEDIKTSDDPTVDPDYSSWGSEPAGVSYIGLIPYLIRGFQEHHAENVALKKENETMKAQIAMLMKAVGLVDSGNVDSA